METRSNVLFMIGDWIAKVGSQETPGVTGKLGLGVQNEAGQRLIEFCQENELVIPNTLFQQHKRRLYTWTSPDDQHQNQTDYILRSQKWSSIQLLKTLGFPDGSADKKSTCNAGDKGDMGSIPGSGRSPEEEMATGSSILP